MRENKKEIQHQALNFKKKKIHTHYTSNKS